MTYFPFLLKINVICDNSDICGDCINIIILYLSVKLPFTLTSNEKRSFRSLIISHGPSHYDSWLLEFWEPRRTDQVSNTLYICLCPAMTSQWSLCRPIQKGKEDKLRYGKSPISKNYFVNQPQYSTLVRMGQAMVQPQTILKLQYLQASNTCFSLMHHGNHGSYSVTVTSHWGSG